VAPSNGEFVRSVLARWAGEDYSSIASADSALDWEIRAVLGLIAEPRALR